MKFISRCMRRRRVVARRSRHVIDADLGGGVIKQRVARPGAGKSGGYRTLAAEQAAIKLVGAPPSDRGRL
jgi:hypothetical protein